MNKRTAPEIVTGVRSATKIIVEASDVSRETARKILASLVKAGFAVVPLEPTNSMFDAYVEALNAPAHNHRTIIANIGKARKRWKAMVTAGVRVAFSDQERE